MMVAMAEEEKIVGNGKVYVLNGEEYMVYTGGEAEYIAVDNTGGGYCGDCSLGQLKMEREGFSLSEVIEASRERGDTEKARSRDLRKAIVEKVDEEFGPFFHKGKEGRTFKQCLKGGLIRTMGMFKKVIRAGGYLDDRSMILGSKIYALEGFALVKADSSGNLSYAQEGIFEPVRRSAALVLWDRDASHFQALFQVKIDFYFRLHLRVQQVSIDYLVMWLWTSQLSRPLGFRAHFLRSFSDIR